MKDKKNFLIIENFRSGEKLKSEVINWGFSSNSLPAGSSKNSGPTDLMVTRFSDKNYTLLMNAMLAPRFFPKIMLVEENNSGSVGGSRTLFSLFNVLVANYQQSRGRDHGRLTETITFKFEAFSII